MPTATQIARQASCSVRSIFERFSDLNALSLATADYAIAQGQAEAVARSFDGDRPTRIQSHVETRARACEKWGPLWRIITSLDELVELRSRIVMVRLGLRSTGCGRRLDNRRPFHILENQLGRPV